MIIFTHIAVCSGSSFQEAVVHNFKTFWKGTVFDKIAAPQGLLPELLKNNRKLKFVPKDGDWDSFLVKEHFPHGIHKIFNTDNYKYTTILRNPIIRCRSAFYKTVQYPNNATRYCYERCNHNLVDTLNMCAEKDICSNIMTKQFSGMEPFENINTPLGHKRFYTYYRATHNNKKPYTEDEMETFLEAAKKNLETYDFIGFQEDNNETYKRFCKQYNLDYKHDEERHRKTARRLVNVDMDNPDIVEALRRMNKYDIRLYNYARNKLCMKI